MPCLILKIRSRRTGRPVRRMAFWLLLLGSALSAVGQNTPLLSGGVGFLTNTNGGNTTYTPVLEPVIAAPIGQHLLVESRATLLETWFPGTSSQPGYMHVHFA